MTTVTDTDTKQRNAELLPFVAAGDQSARDEMVVLNMPLVSFKVDAYLSCFPHLEYLRDDLVSEGNVALIEAVDRCRSCNGGSINPIGYLSVAIHKQIGHFVDSEIFANPDRTTRFRRQQGKDPERSHKVPNSDFVLSELFQDTRKEAELLELILDCCESEEERAIVDLRIKGYKDDEIASQLEMSKTAVFMLRRELYQRCLATGEIVSD